MLVKYYIEKVVMRRWVNKSSKPVTRFVYMVLMLVAIRLYIRECIIPFDVIYAEEPMTEEIQQEEKTEGVMSLGQKALIVSGIIVISYLLGKNMQVSGDVMQLKNQMGDVMQLKDQIGDVMQLKDQIGDVMQLKNQMVDVIDITKVNGGEIQNIKSQIDNLNYIMDATEEKVKVAFTKVQVRFTVLNEAITNLENKITSGEISASSEDV